MVRMLPSWYVYKKKVNVTAVRTSSRALVHLGGFAKHKKLESLSADRLKRLVRFFRA